MDHPRDGSCSISTNGRKLVSRTPGARKSRGEYKPLVVYTFEITIPADGSVERRQETEVIGTDYFGLNEDGSSKQGKFGMYRGTTFATRDEALAHAADYIAALEAREAADAARRAARAQGAR